MPQRSSIPVAESRRPVVQDVPVVAGCVARFGGTLAAKRSENAYKYPTGLRKHVAKVILPVIGL
jgi:hypothetical protein